MALGTFSNGGLGFGLAFVLEDQFSNVADKINDKLDNLADHSEAITNRIDKAFKQFQTGAVIAGIGAAIIAPFVAGIEVASDYSENLNKLEVAFGSYAGQVKQFTDGALDNFGIDKVMASDMASLFGDMATGMGFTQDKAASMSTTLVGLAGDLASFKNISHDVAKNALKGAFTGETEALKNLGIVMTEANLQEWGNRVGQFAGKFNDLSQQEKVLARFNYILAMSKNSVGDFLRTQDGYANSKRIFQGAIKEIGVSLGSILMPVAAKVFQGFSKLLKAMNAFADSPVGRFVLTLVVILGGLLIVLGAVIMSIASAKLATIFLTNAFSGATRAAILKTIATKGLTAGLRQMAAAAWASLGPYLLIAAAIIVLIAIMYKAWNLVTKGSEEMAKIGTVIFWLLGPIGWLVGAIAGIKRGFENLNQPLEKMQTGGVIGFFTKFAAILETVKQIWDSWNGSEFTLTEDLYAKLQALGIMPLAEKIGMVIIRIKQFFLGVKEGFAPFRKVLEELKTLIKDNILNIWEQLKTSLSSIWATFKQAFGPMAAVLENLYQKFFGTEQSLLSWKNAGKLVGSVLLFVFEMIIEYVKMGVTVISWIIQGVIFLVGKIIELYIVITSYLGAAWSWAKDRALEFLNWMFTLPIRFVAWGVNMGMSILSGVKSAWASLTAWFDTALDSIGNKISSKLSGIWDSAKSGFGLFGDDKPEPTSGNPNPANPIAPAPSKRSYVHTVTSKSPARFAMGGAGNSGNGSQQNQPIILQNIMDGDVISERVIDRQNFKNSRNS